MNKTAAMIACLLGALTVPAWAQDTQRNVSIVGVWRLVELTNYNADGTFVRPLGNPPAGTFTYTPDGHLSIQIMKVPPPAPIEGRPTDAEVAESARGYIGYFGTYDIDYESMTVTHNVEGALNPNYVDTERERAITIRDDTLEIDIHSPDGRRAYRRLTRIEDFAEASSPIADFDKLTSLNRPRHHVLMSDVLERDFHLFVRLPDDYDPTADAYPTVYLLDGDITFPMLGAYEQYLSFFDETADVLLVGIAYGAKTQAEGNMRRWDYTAPSTERDDWGGAAAFQEMLRREALPLIERAYHTDPNRRILFGQSLGGQFVLYTALTQPDLFWGHIASNPAIYANRDYFLDFEFDMADRTDSRLVVTTGSDELTRYREPMDDWLAHWSSTTPKPWDFHAMTLDGHSHVSIGPAAYRQGLAWLFANEEEGE